MLRPYAPTFLLVFSTGSRKKSMKEQLASLYFEIRRHYFQWRYPTISIAPGVKIAGKFRVEGGARLVIGSGCRLCKRVVVSGPGEMIIGNNTVLNGPWIGCHSRITIGDNCLISDCYLVDTDYHNLEPELRHLPPGPKVTAPIAIGRNVWIGARATVMKGVEIGADSVIGLGSVVRKSVPPGVVVIGNPQEVVKCFEIQNSKLEIQN
jgi:acetyltransferase-like isoleucine patch superfamily enzyme